MSLIFLSTRANKIHKTKIIMKCHFLFFNISSKNIQKSRVYLYLFISELDNNSFDYYLLLIIKSLICYTALLKIYDRK